MGYTTDFEGYFEFNKPVTKELREYINLFNHTRRMKRNPAVIKDIDANWKKHCFHGELGKEGAYYTQADCMPAKYLKYGAKTDEMIHEDFGQLHDISILDYNCPPADQPGLWCQWCIDDVCGKEVLIWDGGEKFYYYDVWLKYLIKNFFEPEGYVLNGTVEWQGEDQDDFGTLIVENNKVTIET